MKIKSANNLEACLIYCADNVFRIRIYNKDHSFSDYDILHNDLTFTITDTDAFLYEADNGKCYLDHSPETLGMKNG